MPSFTVRYEELARAQKTSKGTPAYTRFVNRTLGRVIAAASPSWMTPDGLTRISGLFSYGGLLLLWLLPLETLYFLLPATLLLIGYAFDSADGQLARLRKIGSPFGNWLDHMLDGGRGVFLHISVVAFLLRWDLSLGRLAFCAVFLVSMTLLYTGGLLIDSQRSTKPSVESGPSSRTLFRSLILLPVDYGVICLMFFLLPWPSIFVDIYMMMAIVSASYCSVMLARWARELKA